MSNSVIAKSNPARDLLNTIIRKCVMRVSKKEMLESVEYYGDYVKVMECDKRLISETIKTNKRADLTEALNELYGWYFKMDCIAARQQH